MASNTRAIAVVAAVDSIEPIAVRNSTPGEIDRQSDAIIQIAMALENFIETGEHG